MPVILDTQEAEIRRIVVEASLGKYFMRPYLEKNHHTHAQKRAEFKHQYCNKTKQKKLHNPPACFLIAGIAGMRHHYFEYF
jgi:hypothetical protein